MSERKPYYYCHIEGNTDVGCVRKANEDWLDSFECDNGLVAVVCDGMGGHVGGQIASHIAVDAIRNFLTSQYVEDVREVIIAACNAANQAILQRAAQQPELTGMGSTCVILIVREGRVYVGSVGDSRIYFIRSKKIKQLTKDQSYVQMLVDLGQITQRQAETHPRKNEITNALGLANMQPATVLDTPVNPEAGDCFLLCSDGLSGMVSDKEIEKIVSNQSGMSQRDRVNTLINKARSNGGLDNITCQIVEFPVTPPLGNQKNLSRSKNLLKIGIPLLLGLGILGLGGYFVHSCFSENEKVEQKKSVEDVVNEDEKFNDIVHNLGISLKYVSDKPVLKVEISEKGKAILKILNNEGKVKDAIDIQHKVSLDSLKVFPDDTQLISVVKSTDNTGKSQCIISLNKNYSEEYLNLVLIVDGKNHIYKFSVENNKSKGNSANGSTVKSRNKKDDTKIGGNIAGKGNTTIKMADLIKVDVPNRNANTPEKGSSDKTEEKITESTVYKKTVEAKSSLSFLTISLYNTEGKDIIDDSKGTYLYHFQNFDFGEPQGNVRWMKTKKEKTKLSIIVDIQKLPQEVNYINIPKIISNREKEKSQDKIVIKIIKYQNI